MCDAEIPWGEGRCWGYSNDWLHITASRPTLCEVQLPPLSSCDSLYQIRIDDTNIPFAFMNGTLCEALGGYYVGPERVSFRKFGACLKLGTTKANGAMVCPTQHQQELIRIIQVDISDCYTSKCIPNLDSTNATCASYCCDPNITIATDCDNSTGSTSTLFVVNLIFFS